MCAIRRDDPIDYVWHRPPVRFRASRNDPCAAIGRKVGDGVNHFPKAVKEVTDYGELRGKAYIHFALSAPQFGHCGYPTTRHLHFGQRHCFGVSDLRFILILPEYPVSLAALPAKTAVLMDAQFAWYMDWATDRLADVHAYADYFGHFFNPSIEGVTPPVR